VSTLQRLASAFGVHINAFFTDPAEKLQLILTRAGERTRSGSASVRLESLGYGLDGQACDPFVVTLKPGANSGRQLMAHQGSEMILVFAGRLEIEIAGASYILGPGDSLLFRAEQPHRWRNPNSQPAQFLMAMQTTAERDESMEQHLHP
jgi:quercetin dioxygenase-like cupin family protein